MKTLTVRISRKTHALLRSLAEESDATMAAIVDEAVREYHKKRFWAGVSASYAALRADSDAWANFRRERDAWDVTLSDGAGGPGNI